MDKHTSNMIRLGIFVTLGTILFVGAIYYLGSSKNLLGNTITLYADFKNVSGLQAGNNVRFMGINVGSVDEIAIHNDTTLRVKMIVKKSMNENMKKDAIVSIGTDGLVGASLVNINPVSGKMPPIEDGDVLNSYQGKPISETMKSLNSTNDNLLKLSQSLVEISEKINLGEGLIGRLLNDNNLANSMDRLIKNINQTSDTLLVASSELNSLIEEVHSGKGFLGYLINDTTLVTSVESMIDQLDTVIDSQITPTFIELSTSAEEISALTSEFRTIAEEINEGKGALGVLLKDKQTEAQIKNIIENIDSSSVKLDENLMALRRNWLFKKYFKEKKKRDQEKEK